ncbi:MAG TPA: DUF3224 domain-containing protein [Terriglobales bacterium]|nr:DUF3224 domain-containing protein [Terriglobales bacterium]
MKTILFMIACLAISALLAQEHSSNAEKEKTVTTHARGTFDVKVTPDPSATKDSVPGRMLLDKQFHGDIEGTSKGQMLTAGDFAKGSAGYVAIEQVTGTLAGRTGSFALQHSGTVTNGAQELHIKVVPGSGTGQLEGITGTMMIEIKDKKHFYDFEYTLPAQH